MNNPWIKNKSFIQWCLFPLEEDHLYWENFMKQHPEHRDEMEEAIRLLKSTTLNIEQLSSGEKDQMYDLIQSDIQKNRKRKRIRLFFSLSGVASILILLFLIQNNPFIEDKPALDSAVLFHTDSVNSQDVQLILANNETYTFERDANITLDTEGAINVHAGEEQLKIKHADTDKYELNTLIVPKGKRSNLTLPDGTKVWVNSGTTLKYPTQFKKNKREVWANGEIYIEVAKNDKQPFYVNTPRMIIDVIGTQFNVMAYSDDAEHSVVLVEGRVHINVDNEKINLQPNYKFSLSGNTLSTQKVDVDEFTSWKDGYLKFTSEPLSVILTRLSRYYNIPIECEDDIAAMKCTGKLVLFDDIEKAIKTINNILPIRYIFYKNTLSIEKQT